MSPRRSVADAARTRESIIARGVQVASLEGLEGLTIGRLAADLGLSKSGVLGHFGSKESLQLAVLDTAAQVFWHQVWESVPVEPGGLPRLRAICAAWVGLLERRTFPGGCFFTAVTSEFDDRDGSVRESVLMFSSLWQKELRVLLRQAISAGELPADIDLDQMIFELIGLMMGLNHAFQLHRDRAAPDRARRAVNQLLDRPPLVLRPDTEER